MNTIGASLNTLATVPVHHCLQNVICDRIWEKGNFVQNDNFTTFQTHHTKASRALVFLLGYTNTSGLLLHRPNVKRFSMPPVSSGELPKWGIKQQFRTVGSIHTRHTHNGGGWVLEILASVAKWSKNIHSKSKVSSSYSFKVISVLKPKFRIWMKLPFFSDPAAYLTYSILIYS